MEDQSVIGNPILVPLIIAILVDRLGGSVEITQFDIDNIAYNCLWEGMNPNGSFNLRLERKELCS